MSSKHEEILIELAAQTDYSLQDLHLLLMGRGYYIEDDFYFKSRADTVMAWQTEELVTIDVFDGNIQIEIGDLLTAARTPQTWSRLVVSYLMATMPEETLDLLLAELEAIAAEFDVKVLLGGHRYSLEALRGELQSYADEFAALGTPVGSQELAILIESQYLG